MLDTSQISIEEKIGNLTKRLETVKGFRANVIRLLIDVNTMSSKRGIKKPMTRAELDGEISTYDFRKRT